MATYSKIPLSGSPTGAPITLPSYATTTVHTTGTSLTVLDEVWLYISNAFTATTCDLYIGGVQNTYLISIPQSANMKLIIPGLVFSGNGTLGTKIEILEQGGSSWLNVTGYVNRITP